MIYILTAMYAEAHPFIARFQLKKDISHTRFQVFLDREADLCLVISGPGSIPAAVAAGSICTEYHAGQGDFLLNVGVCGQIRKEDIHSVTSSCQTGKIFLCNKITEQVTGRTFYPDILYRHNFAEAQIITGAVPYVKAEMNETEDTDFRLYDMEAAAVYQAGAYFFGPHQMHFIKIISDDGKPENVTSRQLTHLVDKNMESIADYMSTLLAAAQNISPESVLPIKYQSEISPHGHDTRLIAHADKLLRKDTVQKDLEQLCLDLHCSKVMADTVRHCLCYCMLADVDYISVVKDMYRTGKLPCKDKQEGKKRLEELKKQLL